MAGDAHIEDQGRDPRTRRARIAVMAVFFIHGAVFANWVPLIPTVQQKLGLSSGTLGLALLGSAVGSLISMPLAGGLISRLGSRRVVRVSGLVYCAALLLPILAPSLPALFLALLVFGAFQGATDVAMNAQGIAVQGRLARPILSALHGLWSLGGLAGAAVSAVLAAIGVAPLPHVLGAALLLGAALAVATAAFLPHGVDAVSQGPAFARLSRPLIGLGIIGFCALIAEGSIGDWGALYLRHIVGAGPSLATAGYAIFTLTMTIGRLTGDRLTVVVGPVPLIRLGGVFLALGLGIALILTQTAATFAGFALAGIALANIVPILFTAAGRIPNLAPGPAIAAVSTASFSGFLVGPPVIGVTADHLTLRGGLAIVVLLGVLIALLAPVVGHTGAAGETAVILDPGAEAVRELA